MLYDQKRQWFECLKSFSHLNGRKKQEIVVGDNADARIAKFWFRDRVKHNWPSQWHTRYKGGYIEFENGEKTILKIRPSEARRRFFSCYSGDTHFVVQTNHRKQN